MNANIAHRLAIGIAITAAALMFWLAMGVGILGADGDASDRIFIGVLGVGLAGALLSRSARGFSMAMFATALAQAAVAGLAIGSGLHLDPASSLTEILSVNGVFVVMFATSGVLFQISARKPHPDALN
jgi:hypothetical protein